MLGGLFHPLYVQWTMEVVVKIPVYSPGYWVIQDGVAVDLARGMELGMELLVYLPGRAHDNLSWQVIIKGRHESFRRQFGIGPKVCHLAQGVHPCISPGGPVYHHPFPCNLVDGLP